MSRHHVDYGNGSYVLTEQEAAGCDVGDEELASLFRESFDSPSYQPPLLPSTAIELMNLTRRPDVTFPVVAALLEREPLLAGQVLRLAQSPVYRRLEPIRSLEHAASLLGLRALGDLFLQASLSARVFRAPGYEAPMTRLRDHAVATALVSRLVCRETSLSDDYAFLCGLLHDVGTAACIIVLAKEFGRERGTSPVVPLATFWPVVRQAHEAIAAKLAQMWQLPADVRLVIGHHHSLLVGGMVHPLAAVVCVADSIASDLGHGFESEGDVRELFLAVDSLGLTPAHLRGIRRDAERLLTKK